MVLFITTIAVFLTAFAGSSINVALPAIADALDMAGVTMSWVATAFVLTSAVLLLPAGRAGDVLGRRRVFLWGMAVYGAGSLAACLSPWQEVLIAARALTGLGAALVFATQTAILVASYPPQQRGRVLGINVAAVYTGLSMGPFLGGLATQYLGWRALFGLHAGLSVAVLVLAATRLRGEWTTGDDDRFDRTGAVGWVAALTVLLAGLAHLPRPWAVAAVAAGLAGLAAFFAHERRVATPLLDVRQFQGNRVFVLSNVAAMINYSATFSVGFFASLFLQVVQGFPPRDAGIVLVAQPVVQAVFSPLTGRLSDRVEPRVLASLGMGLTAAGLGLLATVDAATGVPFLVGALVLLGLGFALFSSPNTNAVMGAVERRHLGTASAAIATMRVVGQMLSMAVALVLFSVYLGDAPVSPETALPFLDAFRTAFVVAAAMCVAGVFASLARGRVQRG